MVGVVAVAAAVVVVAVVAVVAVVGVVAVVAVAGVLVVSGVARGLDSATLPTVFKRSVSKSPYLS